MRVLLGSAVACSLLLLAGCGDQRAPAATPTSTPTPAHTPAPQSSKHVVEAIPAMFEAGLSPDPASETLSEPLALGPDGVGALRLGMTHQDVANSGLARSVVGSAHDGWSSGCRVVFYRQPQLGRTPGETLDGTVSPAQGLEQLYATPKMATPEGIGLGSTIVDVRAAYDRPGLVSGDLVTVRATPDAVYRIQLSGVVSSLSLELRHLDCTR